MIFCKFRSKLLEGAVFRGSHSHDNIKVLTWELVAVSESVVASQDSSLVVSGRALAVLAETWVVVVLLKALPSAALFAIGLWTRVLIPRR